MKNENKNIADSLDTEILNEVLKIKATKKIETDSFLDDLDIENKENVPLKKEKKEKKNKDSKFKNLIFKIKNWWSNLPKNKKIIVIIIGVLILVTLIIGIVFLVKNKKVEEETPDVIVEVDNYRYENGTLIFLDNGQEIGRYECQNKDENMCFVSFYSEEDEFDKEIKQYENGDPLYLRSNIINKKYVFVTDSPNKDNSILYNMIDNSVKEEYKLVKIVNENEFIVKNNQDKYNIIKVDNEINKILDKNYSYLAAYNDKFIKKENNKEYIIDKSGHELSIGFPYKIKGFNDKYIKTINEFKEYRVYDYKGKEIFKDTYDFIDLQDDFALLVKNKKADLRFYDNYKLIENQLELKNEYYNKIKIYDQDKKLIKTNASYDISNSEGSISINIIDEENNNIISINKNEGFVNKTINYMNYFDGTIYIYSDKNKEILLGSYKCNNKNNISSANDVLTNCNIADEVNGDNKQLKAPIFNERFVFIYDNANNINEDAKNINLYDLKQNKILSNYKEFNSDSGTNEVTFKTVNNYPIICKNKNNKLGIIKLNTSEVKGFIAFNYNTLEVINNYYLGGDDKGYYLIDKNNGNAINDNPIPIKISSYTDNYIIGSDKDNYKIYSKKGEELSNFYNYIDLYNDFYVGIKDNKLGLYTYKDKENNFTGKDINVGGDYKNAYKVTVNGSNYILEVNGNVVVSGAIGGE